jgi:hypothetical protein
MAKRLTENSRQATASAWPAYRVVAREMGFFHFDNKLAKVRLSADEKKRNGLSKDGLTASGPFVMTTRSQNRIAPVERSWNYAVENHR